jgi:cell division protease FtsH
LKNNKNVILGVISAVILVMIVMLVGGPKSGLFGTPPTELGISALKEKIQNKGIAEVQWQGTEISGKLSDGSSFVTNYESYNSELSKPIVKLFDDNKINVKPVPAPTSGGLMGMIALFAPTLLIFGLLYFFFVRAAQQNGSQAMSFGKSKAKRVGETGTKVTFDDVAGIDEAKQELYEVVDFLRNTKKYAALGAKIPKGILLTGPPGVGKTHLARAIAGEAGVPFFHISGSDFVEMFVGVGAARVRDLFETAKAHRPSLIFVDEIDAVGRQRGAGMGGGHDEREQTLNQLLVEMDGFDPNSGVIMIAATNRPDVLDPALLRPGRFDRQIVVDAPDQVGRKLILGIHAKGKPLEADVDLEVLSKRTTGFTGADLANTLNEGALLAARHGLSKINMATLEEALDRVIAGPQRKSRVIDTKEREIIAYHEGGHAVLGELLDFSDPVYKITVLPRGQSLGSSWQLPTQDTYLVSKEELLDRITTLLGGRVAEEIVYNRVWTGASNDLERVAAIARAMVTKYGMSEKLGTLAIGNRRENPFLGRDYNEERNYSEEVARQIDEEVKGIVERCHNRATELLTQNRDKLDAVVKALLERETLDREEFLAVMEGREMPDVKPAKPEIKFDTSPSVEKSSSAKSPPRLEPGTA